MRYFALITYPLTLKELTPFCHIEITGSHPLFFTPYPFSRYLSQVGTPSGGARYHVRDPELLTPDPF